ncbi:baseplate J/gp47 family protein [Chloroflexus sp.]|uniref:baseplate J/gp47 family protein n=1 Tax=Chloroflexus sp. TaxID=1904827 RepID=UPI002ADE7241|nr:baseplate J/gp47 family protein [Chloroflexus sp.]
MMTDETALVLALPEDTAESLMAKVRTTHAANVQILAPEGTVALQRVAGTDALRDLATAAGINLTIISSDPGILKAARQSRLATIEVTGAHVQAPVPSTPFTPGEDLPAEDLEFLAALDELAANGNNLDLFAPPSEQKRPVAADTRPIAAPETRPIPTTSSPSTPATPPAMGDDDLEFFDALDDLAAAFEQERTGTPPPPIPSAREASAQPPRVRPEDIQLSAAEVARADQIGRRSEADRTQRTTAEPRREPRPEPVAPPTRRAATPAPRTTTRSQAQLFRALLIGLIILLALTGILIVVTQSVTIVVRLPVRETTPVVGLAIPITAVSTASANAVNAEPLETTVAISTHGEVTEGVLTPVSSASGAITLFNQNTQPITIPAGSEFVAFGPDNQPIPFISKADVTVPGAVTTRSGNQIITTFGEAAVQIEARSPGSASNIPANTIRELRIAGGPTINLVSGLLTVSHDAIGGGTDEEVRVIKESDVRRYLAQALTDLDQEARRQLDGLALAHNLRLEPTTVSPSRAELEQLAGFELIVDPPIGTSLSRDNPFFTITVQSRYSGLAISGDSAAFQRQLADAFNSQLIQNGQLRPGDCRAAFVQGWRWDGATLRIDGSIGPDPACGNELDPATRAAIQNAVLGRTRTEAEAALQELVAAGRLAGFELPDNVDRFPGWSWQLRIRHE